jgi:hypothetical protein
MPRVAGEPVYLLDFQLRRGSPNWENRNGRKRLRLKRKTTLAASQAPF